MMFKYQNYKFRHPLDGYLKKTSPKLHKRYMFDVLIVIGLVGSMTFFAKYYTIYIRGLNFWKKRVN